jgi:hypothetical protein
MSNDINRIPNLIEGDRISVLTAGGGCDTGVFIRFDREFLVWVRDDGANSYFTLSNLSGISITKL